MQGAFSKETSSIYDLFAILDCQCPLDIEKLDYPKSRLEVVFDRIKTTPNVDGELLKILYVFGC